MRAFLIRCAIPQVSDKDRIPSGCEPGDVIWDAVHRAHRDVLIGRGHIGTYSKHPVTSASGKKAVNGLAVSLYNLIRDTEPGETVDPRETIIALCEEYGDVRYGVIQKLVNMALKYVFILQSHGCLDRPYVDEARLDCPLDSVILACVTRDTGKFKKVRWTTLDDYGTYIAIQDAISSLSPSRLAYDFRNWQSLDFHEDATDHRRRKVGGFPPGGVFAAASPMLDA